MRPPAPVLLSLIVVVMGFAPLLAVAQPVAAPTIHRVTVHPDTGVLTVTGTGLGPDLQVTVDGQPVPQLPGATDTEMKVLAPVTVVAQPGTYRLTVVDPMRRVGDGFVVVSPEGSVVTASDAEPGRLPDDPATTATPGAEARGGAPAERLAPGPTPVIEGAGFTAIGVWSLANATTGSALTAAGWSALRENTSGSANTAAGNEALRLNTTASANSAFGEAALRSNTTGSSNTASGRRALYANATGSYNVASGTNALVGSNGDFNTATGADALVTNTTGSQNVADGTFALYNSTGSSNVAVGYSAGGLATSGAFNVYLGADVTGTASDTNTMRLGLPYDSGTGVGQNQTFIAGISGTQLTGPAVQVYVDANGQLGTLTPPIASGSGTTPLPSALEQQVQAQQATIAAHEATIADLLARLVRLETASVRRR